MELFDIGLDEEEIEASPGFDDLPAEPLKTKIRQRKSTTKKERDYLIRKIQGLSLDEFTLFCLDKVLTLLYPHWRPIVDTQANVSLCPFTAYQTLLLGSTRSFLHLTNVSLKHRYVCFHCSILLCSFVVFQVERV